MFVATSRILGFTTCVAVVCAAVAAVNDAGVDQAQKTAGEILLISGDHYSGTLADTDRAGAVGWQTAFGANGFVFPLDKVKSVVFPSTDSPATQRGDFCFELHGGQTIYGTPLESDDDSLVVDSSRFGRLVLPTNSIARFYRASGASGGLADGLQGLAGWTVEGLPGDWREEAGAIVSETRGASLAREVEVPTRFSIDIEAQWTNDLGVAFNFGDIFRIESWGSDVMAAREVFHTEKRLLPAADVKPADWRYTFAEPDGQWQKPDYDDSEWKLGKSGFGQAGIPHTGTLWNTPDIWIRRTFDMRKTEDRPYLHMWHDEDAKVYINGVLAADVASHNDSYEILPISDEAMAALKPTGNVMAIHCRQTGGGQYIDAGIVSSNMPPDELLADVTRIPSKEDGPGIHVRCFVDRQVGFVKIVNFADKSARTIRVKPADPVPDSPESILVRLASYSSHVRIKQFALNLWDGKDATFESQEGLRVRLVDGRLIEGDDLSIDEPAGEFVVSGDEGDVTFPKEQVQSVTFGARADRAAPPYWLSLDDGSVLSGELTGIKQSKIQLKTTLAERDLAIPTADLRSLTNVAAKSPKPSAAEKTAANSSPADGQKAQDASAEKTLLLEAEGVVSHGALEDAKASDEAFGLSWRPTDSLSASPIRRDARLRILFRGEAREAVPAEDPQIALLRAQGVILGEPSASEKKEKEKRPPAPALDGGKQYVVLVNGDRVDCHVTEFDETGLYIESDFVAESFIPADQVRIWETNRETWLEAMNKEKRRRLLTLPRKQREKPPTHIVESVGGDFMRTRLLKGDEENLFALVQLKEHKIPRSLVQRVVWLPPAKGTKKDEQTPAAEKQPVSITGVSSRGTAQAIIDDSLRVTMQLEGLADGKLIGESSVLGDCNVAIDRLIELRLGGLEVEDAHKVAVAQWRLQDAIDPIYMQDQELAENGRMTAGLNFPLVGKAAPDFTAPTLSGDAVQLSGLRGRVVVLDFWASWCGPCIQAFPEIVSLADSYDDDKVQLISVNMGEDKESMVACLERLKLSPTVAMDEQGRVADQYLVESIPQTVVISPKGEVARVFVGSTPNLQKQLRFAIDELLAP